MRGSLVWVFALTILGMPAHARAAAIGSWGVDLSDQDRTARPGDDFAMYQNGSWFRRVQISPQQPNAAYWRDVRIAANRNIGEMLSRLEAEGGSIGHVHGLVRSFHRSALNEAVINARGLEPLRPQLDSIRAARDKSAFARAMGAAEGPGTVRNISARLNPGRNLFQLQIGQDRRDPTRYALYVSPAGLVMPGPEYYTDPRFADVKASYRAYIAKMLGLASWPNPELCAKQIVDLETQIARVSPSHEEAQQFGTMYNRVTSAKLTAGAPGFEWKAFLAGAGVPGGVTMVANAPGSLSAIAKIYAKAPLDILKAKQVFGALHVDAIRLSSDVYGAYRGFATTALAGFQAGPDRSLDAINLIESVIPDAVGAIYVENYSSPVVKAKASQMADLMKQALDRRIASNPDISPAGKAAARAKLDALRIHVGYPDRFDSYPALVARDDDLYGNVSRAAAYDWRVQVAKLKRPFDRSEWTLTPFYPQYGYTPTSNTAEIPAALLVPPFFDPFADDAVNFGADGTTIGFEIALALTGPGLDYDADGRLKPWLPPSDRAILAKWRDALSTYYSQEQPLPGMHLKGELLADEAMADLVGVQIALDAYHASLNGQAAAVLDGFTGDQRFFLGRAQMWRAKFSPEFTRNQVATGSNAPPYMRINGPLANLDAWYTAFGIAPGDKLYIPPDQRVRGW